MEDSFVLHYFCAMFDRISTSYLLQFCFNRAFQDSSIVNVWTDTQPPLAVFDPDIDVNPPDPLIISLLGNDLFFSFT